MQGSNPGLLHWHVDSEPPGNTGLLCGKLQRHCTCPKAPLGGAFKVSMPNCFSPAGLFVTLWNVTHHAPLSIGFSRLECWNGLSFPSPGDFPDPGIKPHLLCLLHWQTGSLPLVPPGKPKIKFMGADKSNSIPRQPEAENAGPQGPWLQRKWLIRASRPAGKNRIPGRGSEAPGLLTAVTTLLIMG